MRFAEYAQKLSALARTVNRWLALAAKLDALRREKVALYAEEVAATLARAARDLSTLEAAPNDSAALLSATRELGRIGGYVETIVSTLEQHLDGRKPNRSKFASFIRRLKQQAGSNDTMSSGKWRPQEFRNLRKRGQVWQLRQRNSPAAERETGRKFTVYSLGYDVISAVAEAERLRRFPNAGSHRLPTIRAEVPKKARESSGSEYSLVKLAEHNRDVISPKTYSARIEAINRAGIRFLSDVPHRKAATAIIDRLMTTHSRATVSLTARTLSTIWNIARSRGVCENNPWECQGIRVPKTEKRPLTAEEFGRVLDVAEPNSLGQSLVLLLGLTGLRVGAALSIRPAHVEGDRVLILKDKTFAGRRTIMSETALAALAVVMEHRPTYESARYWVTKLYGLSGLGDEPVDTHSLRRTAAQALVDNDVAEHVAAALIGHSYQGSMTFSKYAVPRQDLPDRLS